MIIDPMNAATLTSGALTAAEASIDALLGTAGVTLAAAQLAKSNFADAIFHAKRQAPIALTVTAGAYNWDARDETVNALTLATQFAVWSASNTAFSAALSGLTERINEVVNSTNTALSTISASSDGSGGVNFTGPGSVSGVAEPAPVFLEPSINWTPIGATSPVSLSPPDVANLVYAIITRRVTLQGIRLSRQATIAACANVAAVIAATVATGWP
jgi:hypothetical protein